MEVVNNTMAFSKIMYSEKQEDLYELVGTIKTDVVPIEYYDFESKKKALKIKRLLDEKASLYKTLFANIIFIFVQLSALLALKYHFLLYL